MAGHSRSKNGVASLAYVPAIHVSLAEIQENVDARHKAGHDESAFLSTSPTRYSLLATLYSPFACGYAIRWSRFQGQEGTGTWIWD
jgi:hypothetical protein